MDISSLVQNYGYMVVFFGTFLEGETILIMAGFAAHRGYLSLPWVIAVAVMGSFAGDQLYFALGKHYGPLVLHRFPALRSRAERVQTLLNHYDRPLILSIRFFYGLRTVGPMVIGMSEVSWERFLLLNFAGAVLWAILFTSIGYIFGSVMEVLITDLRRFEEGILVVIAIAGIGWWWLHRYRGWLLPWEK